jgi:hypothetical protein
MTFLTPMVRQIAGCVFNHSDSKIAKLQRLPVRLSSLAVMFRFLNNVPVNFLKRYDIHH